MAVASAGPYASLHLAPDRQPRQHPTTRFLQAISASTTVTKQQFQSASKRKSFFSSPKTSVSHKHAKVSNAHLQISSMAQSRCSQIDEQLCLMKAREDREKELHKLNIEYLKEKQQREAEAHKIDMKIKEMQLQLLEKQLQ